LDETGIYYYGARYYDPAIGRFISQDIIVQNHASPQSFNRYSYVLNNPLKYVDSMGRAAKVPINTYRPIIDPPPPPPRSIIDVIVAFGKSKVERACAVTESAIRSGNVEPAPINSLIEDVAAPALDFCGAGISTVTSNPDVGYTMFLLEDEGWGATALDVATRGHPGITLPDPFGGPSLVVINENVSDLPATKRHEEIHVMQQQVLGGPLFTALYFLAEELYGYWDNPFEVQANELSVPEPTPETPAPIYEDPGMYDEDFWMYDWW